MICMSLALGQKSHMLKGFQVQSRLAARENATALVCALPTARTPISVLSKRWMQRHFVPGLILRFTSANVFMVMDN